MSRVSAVLFTVLAIAGIAVGTARLTHASVPGDILYGASGGIFTIDLNDGSRTPVGEPSNIRPLTLAFDSTGRLFVVDQFPPGGPSLLHEVDPLTGEIVNTIGPVLDAFGSPLAITALSVQPETDVLFGSSLGECCLNILRIWTIDKSTATATLVASEVPAGCEFNCSTGKGMAFAPDGTLYHKYFRGGTPFPPFEEALLTLDPSTGAELSSVPLEFPAPTTLAVRSDGTLFGSLTTTERGGGDHGLCLPSYGQSIR